MKTVSVALNTHLQGSTTTLAWLWKVTRRDGAVFGFTDHDVDLTLSGVTYSAATGMLASAAQARTGASVDNMEIAGMLDSAAITDADILSGKWDGAAILVSICNWSDLTQGSVIIQSGTIGNISLSGVSYKAEMRSIGQALQQTVGRTMRRQCDANFGDSRCGINLASWTSTGSVTGVTDRQTFACSVGGTVPFGKVTWTSGANVGLYGEVRTIASNSITLALPMPYAIAVGDGYTVTTGCDKNRSTCVSYNNITRFRGFPDIPGADAIHMYPNANG